MPSYKYLRKAELIQLCDDKGINHASFKTKADLIAVIEQYDLYNDVITDENQSDDGDNDECVNETENAVTWLIMNHTLPCHRRKNNRRKDNIVLRNSNSLYVGL